MTHCLKMTFLFALAGVTSGCLSPVTTRYPSLATKNPEVERRESQLQDPYPDDHIGPDTGFRPLGFEDQRSEPQNAKDRFYGGYLHSRNGAARPISPPGTVMLPPQGMVLQPGPQGYAMQPPPGYVMQAPPGMVMQPPPGYVPQTAPGMVMLPPSGSGIQPAGYAPQPSR